MILAKRLTWWQPIKAANTPEMFASNTLLKRYMDFHDLSYKNEVPIGLKFWAISQTRDVILYLHQSSLSSCVFNPSGLGVSLCCFQRRDLLTRVQMIVWRMVMVSSPKFLPCSRSFSEIGHIFSFHVRLSECGHCTTRS